MFINSKLSPLIRKPWRYAENIGDKKLSVVY